MVEKAKQTGNPLTRESLYACGKDIEYLPGVEGWFERIDRYAQEAGVEVEHYVLSSGLKEIIEGTSIAKYFKKIYACEFLYKDGQALWAKMAVNYTNKTQFIFKINKGVESVYDSTQVNRYIPEDDRPVPFKHMIYVGDGTTDIPCMRLVKNFGGHSIAVFNPEQESGRESLGSLIHDNRVNHICPADYTEGGEMDRVVKMIIDKMSLDDKLEKMEIGK